MDNDRPNTTISGPGFSSRPKIGPEGATDPGDLLDEARLRIHEEDERNKEGVKLARRLIVAFILILILGVVCYAVLPQWGLRLPPIVPALSFIAILIGAVLTGIESSNTRPRDPDPDRCDDGCAVGMCSGPRPLKMFRDPKDDRES